MNETEIHIFPNENCQWAYTYMGYQPVRCSWISDQPLEFSLIPELKDPLLEQLEREVLDIKNKRETYDKYASRCASTTQTPRDLFRLNAGTIGFQQGVVELEGVLDVLRSSSLGAILLDTARVNGVTLVETNQTVGAQFCPHTKELAVRKNLNSMDKVLLLVRELRKATRGQIEPLDLHPDYAVLIERARLADEAVFMIVVAWEIAWAGRSEMWTKIHESSLNDIARSFGSTVLADFRTIKNGKALLSAFESWFLSERCRKNDRHLIQKMLSDYTNYEFDEDSTTSLQKAKVVLKSLGSVPFASNYLESSVNQIVCDPVFTEVRDRANANFMWFIKFERSYSKMETVAEVRTEEPKGVVLQFPTIKKGEFNRE